MALLQDVWQVFVALSFPWQFMYMSLSFLPGTLRRLYASDQLLPFSWPRIKDAWFSDFWAQAGVNIRKFRVERIAALVDGRVTRACVVDEPVMPPVNGVVLDVGPGQGFWVDIYARYKAAEDDDEDGHVRSRNRNKLKVYGIEPSTAVHAQLSRRVDEAGLKGTYEILPVGIESLSTCDIEPGSVDCIVSVLCLCGIPEPEKNVGELYKYLRKGGRWYLYEHVRVRRSWWVKIHQAVVNVFWPHLIGGCELCRDTETTLRRAGPWDRIDLAQPLDEPWYATVPHIFGTLTK